MELTFTEEEIPKITRVGGSGREAEPWEKHLASLKDSEGKSFRVWTYEKRSSAVSRMSSVRDRLTKAVPNENWKLAVRVVPGTENTVHPDGATNAEGTSIAGQSAEQFGVYVAYMGTFTDEQVAENQRIHQERSERVRKAREAADAARAAEAANGASTNGEGQSEPTAEPTAESELSAKERVAAARNAQKAGASK